MSDSLLPELASAASTLGWRLDELRLERLLAWMDAVLAMNERVNLTAKLTREEALERHLVDSLALGLHLKELPGRGLLVDLGTGGGFPGAPLAIALPKSEVHLVDGRSRKVRAIEEMLDAVGIENARTHAARLGSLRDQLAGRADVITARAVAPLEKLVVEAAPFLAPGGCLVAWKSIGLEGEEREAGDRQARRSGLHVLVDIEYDAGPRRRLVRYRRPAPARGS